MSIRSRFGVAAAAVLLMGASAGVYAQGGCSGGGKISKQIAKPMDAANKAIQARKWQEVLAKVREAEATTGYIKSAFDQFYMNEFKGYAYSQLNQGNDAVREFEASLNSPCMAEGKKQDRIKAIANLYYSMRQYPKAIEFAQRGLKYGRDAELLVTMGQAQFQSGQNKEAAKTMSDVMSAFEQQGKAPKEQTMLLVLAACERAGDNNCVTRLYEKLVTYYPKPDYWSNLTTSIVKGQLSDTQKIAAMRLSITNDVMKRSDEFKEMAQIALDKGLPGEAKSIIDQGFAKKIFKDEREISLMKRLGDKADAEIKADQPKLAQQEAAAKAAATGDDLVTVGAKHMSYGDNVKAIELIKAGIAKGKLTDSDEAGMLLGIAYLRNKQNAEAQRAFKSVTKDPTMKRLAALWVLKT